jgi:DNA-binding MarR family transcriptional regulator
MSDLPSDAVVLAWVRLNRAQTRVLDAIEAALKAAGHPPLAWYDVLWELERAGRLRAADLQARLLFAQYNLSRLLDRMLRDGLIARHPHETDGRAHWIAPTSAGLALRAAMWPVYARALQARLGTRLGTAEARTVAAALARIE